MDGLDSRHVRTTVRRGGAEMLHPYYCRLNSSSDALLRAPCDRLGKVTSEDKEARTRT